MPCRWCGNRFGGVTYGESRGVRRYVQGVLIDDGLASPLRLVMYIVGADRVLSTMTRDGSEAIKFNCQTSLRCAMERVGGGRGRILASLAWADRGRMLRRRVAEAFSWRVAVHVQPRTRSWIVVATAPLLQARGRLPSQKPMVGRR